MTNKQPEKSVDEFKRKFCHEYTDPQGDTFFWLKNGATNAQATGRMIDWLTQTLQAERQKRDEMERIRSMNYATKCLEAGTLLLYDVALTLAEERGAERERKLVQDRLAHYVNKSDEERVAYIEDYLKSL